MKNIMKKNGENTGNSIMGLILNEFKLSLTHAVSSTIEVPDTLNTYQSLSIFLYHLNPKKYKEYMISDSKSTFPILSSNICYYLKIGKQDYLRISTHTIINDGNNSVNVLKIIIFSKQHVKIRKWIMRNGGEFTPKNNVPIVYINEDTYPYLMNCNERHFNSIVMDSDLKKDLIEKLMVWKNDKEWYTEHQLVYKKGVLLYGKPGTGKSSIVKAISNMFNNALIITTDVESLSGYIRNILQYRKTYKDTIIILIEDIDMYFKDRKDNVDDNLSSEQNILFQLIDGAYSTDNTIYIATTNYLERLDDALVRPGRFDIRVNLEYYEKDLAIKFVERFGYNEDDLLKMNVTYPIQPALLQSKVMEYRGRNKLLQKQYL